MKREHQIETNPSIYTRLKCAYSVMTNLSFATLIFFIILLAVSGPLSSHAPKNLITNMKVASSSFESNFFIEILGLEVPAIRMNTETDLLNTKSVLLHLFQAFIGFDLSNPTQILAQTLPGNPYEQPVLIFGQNTFQNEYPLEVTPPASVFVPDPNKTAPVKNEKTNPIITPRKEAEDKKYPIYIYHTHNRESWLPELEGVDTPDQAFDSEKNVTLLGERLQDQLLLSGVPSEHSDIDYPSMINDFNYAKSYQYSKATIQEALAVESDYGMWLDIHRDSQGRDRTTVTYKNQSFAQVYFVIGEKNPNWETNAEFAKQLHDKLNEKIPGLSKGIYNKNVSGSDNEYNQSHSSKSSLIEIGGVENTLDESYRTVDILSEVIAEMYFENQNAVPVNSSSSLSMHEK
jgi:stage II sporulation protein P